MVEEKIKHLENIIVKLTEELETITNINRNHLIRIKNHEYVNDDTIYYGLPYSDLSPRKAFEAYSKNNFNFMLLDVSEPDYKPSLHFEDVLKIPLEDLAEKCEDFLNRKIPILVISEDGLRSIKACELLSKKGFYNLSNVSGGYKFWPGAKDINVTSAKSA